MTSAPVLSLPRSSDPIAPDELERFYDRPTETVLADPAAPDHHRWLLEALESGAVRTAVREADGSWRAVPWVKSAILLGFRLFGTLELTGAVGPAFDRAAYPPRFFDLEDRVRLVPGGSAVRRGAHLAPGVVVMPPAYVNVGAWVGADTMIDSHALIGSCAQVGARVHVSAGVQIGGVLEPAGSRPVVVEDDAFLGAQSGLFEGVLVRERAVLAPGVLLTSATTLYDLVRETTWQGEVPAGAVVVPGTRPARGALGAGLGLGLYAPVIVKYRDDSTDAATQLEEALR